MNALTANGVFNTLAIAAILAWFYTLWQSLVVDVVRQKMFEARDAALLWAHENNRLSDPSYITFRNMINANIRHYESLSIFKILLANKILNRNLKIKDAPSSFMGDFYLKNSFKSVTRTAVYGLFARSFLIVAIAIVFLPLFFLMFLIKGPESFRFVNKLSSCIEADLLQEH